MIKNRIIFFIFILGVLIPSFDNHISLINFNIHGFNTKSNENKVSEIINNISNFDLIFFQENWSYQNKIKNELQDYFFISSNRKSKILQGSGLTIGIKNKFLVVEFEEVFFDECHGIFLNGNDCFASKGFIYSRVKLNNIYIDIYNTHLDAGISKKDQLVRSKQLSKLKQYIYKKSLGKNIIVCGDFNINYLDKNRSLINSLCDSLKLNFVQWNENYFLEYKIDYIFYSKNFNFFNESIPDTLFYLSDHPPMQAYFEIIE